MFTGIVEEVGKIKGIKKGSASARLTIEARLVLEDAKIGDSISVNGVCLTVTDMTGREFTADVMHETLDKSSLGKLLPGSRVNLERAMPVGGRFGGHIVSGHIDGTGIIADIKRDDNAIWYTIKAPKNIMKYVVTKGSIAIDGISLTVASAETDSLKVSIIPHTADNTILSDKNKGDIVNLENDCIGKYVDKLLFSYSSDGSATRNNADFGIPHQSAAQMASGGITEEFLAKHGF